MEKARFGICVIAASAIAFGLGIWVGKRGGTDANMAARGHLPDPANEPSVSALQNLAASPNEDTPVAIRLLSETEEILANSVPGEVNEVLVDKMRGALDEPDKYKRAAHWQALLSLMRKEDIRAVHQLFPDSDAQGKWHHMEFESYWGRRGEVDPQGTLEELNTTGYLTGGPHRYNVMNSWAQQDGAAAFAHALAEQADGEPASDLLSGAISGWATDDWKGATAALMSEVPVQERSNVVNSLAWSVVYSGGVDEAKKWFAEFGQNFDENPGLVNQAYNTLFEAVARGGGDATADFMVEQADKPWFNRGMLDNLLGGWSQAGPERVFEMIEKLPAEEENLRWIERAAGNWTDFRENGLGNWLIQNPDSPIYDRVTATFSKQIRDVDPEAAKAWMETINDPGLKQKVDGILNAPLPPP